MDDYINIESSSARCHSVRYEAATQSYLIDLPSREEFQFVNENEDAGFWHDFAATGFYEGTIVDVSKPRSTNPEIQLSYTSYGISTGYYSSDFSFFASTSHSSTRRSEL
jgi:hypothetical protein